MRMFLLALFVFTISSAAQSDVVYTSKQSNYFHRTSCKEMSGVINTTSKTSAIKDGYSPCPSCIKKLKRRSHQGAIFHLQLMKNKTSLKLI